MATWTLKNTEHNDLNDFIEEASLDPDFRHAFEDAEARAALLRNLIRARKWQRISQGDVARFMGTTQSAVSDLEGGDTDPQLSTLQRYARAVNARLRVGIEISPVAAATTATAQPWFTAHADRGRWLAAVAARAERERPIGVVFQEILA
jgi:transcriptional regulator with XRE-family HTH domain